MLTPHSSMSSTSPPRIAGPFASSSSSSSLRCVLRNAERPPLPFSGFMAAFGTLLPPFASSASSSCAWLGGTPAVLPAAAVRASRRCLAQAAPTRMSTRIQSKAAPENTPGIAAGEVVAPVAAARRASIESRSDWMAAFSASASSSSGGGDGDDGGGGGREGGGGGEVGSGGNDGGRGGGGDGDGCAGDGAGGGVVHAAQPVQSLL
jgi:hypothetical protein